MHRSIGTAASILALSTSAIAADIANVKTAAIVEHSQQWSGFYSGINIDGAVSVADGVRSTGYFTSD